MLVLTRGENESIMIDDQVEVTILEVRGGKVRFGIIAPSSVKVHRKEVYLAARLAADGRGGRDLPEAPAALH